MDTITDYRAWNWGDPCAILRRTQSLPWYFRGFLDSRLLGLELRPAYFDRPGQSCLADSLVMILAEHTEVGRLVCCGVDPRTGRISRRRCGQRLWCHHCAYLRSADLLRRYWVIHKQRDRLYGLTVSRARGPGKAIGDAISHHETSVQLHLIVSRLVKAGVVEGALSVEEVKPSFHDGQRMGPYLWVHLHVVALVSSLERLRAAFDGLPDFRLRVDPKHTERSVKNLLMYLIKPVPQATPYRETWAALGIAEHTGAALGLNKAVVDAVDLILQHCVGQKKVRSYGSLSPSSKKFLGLRKAVADGKDNREALRRWMDKLAAESDADCDLDEPS